MFQYALNRLKSFGGLFALLKGVGWPIFLLDERTFKKCLDGRAYLVLFRYCSSWTVGSFFCFSGPTWLRR